MTGATPAAVELYEHALATSLAWRYGAADLVDAALRKAPSFVMAQVLKAWLLLAGRDVRRIGAGRPMLSTLARLPANARERLHVAAIRAVVDDNYEGAKRLLGDLLRRYPTDVLALQIAHSLDYLTGDSGALKSRVHALLAAWSPAMPGYDAVLAMHAFSLEENGEFDRAEREALEALASNPENARAHHVL
ncbi:MAG TPA: tetratricopeptide repeat protein, partial [Casimicrobiaceae bacterium]|nr:tetratricopeptide repeat protein [Casimicrobiaceae bacterium]